MRLGHVRQYGSDLALVLAIAVFAWLLTGAFGASGSGAAVLAWAQGALVAIVAVLVLRVATSNPAERQSRRFLAASAAAAFLAISLIARRHDPYFWDAATTSARASLVREGPGLLAGHERFSLFYYFVALLQAVSCDSVAVIRLGAGAVAASGFLGIGLLAARHGGRAAGLAAGCLALGTPALFCLSHWLYIDMFLLAVCVWQLVLCDRWCRRPTRLGLAALLLAAAVGLLTKEYAIVVLPACFGLWWIERGMSGWRAWLVTAPGRRGLVVAVVLLLAIGTGVALWFFYLRFWRGLFPPNGPNWQAWPLVIIPGNPALRLADQIRLIADLVRQNLIQLAGSGLLGFALLGLVEVRSGRRAIAWLVLAGACGLAIWPHLQLEPAPLNRLWRWGPALVWLGPVLVVVLVALRATGVVAVRISRWQAVLLASTAAAVGFFAIIAKATVIDGRVQAFLDWRYTLFAEAFLAMLAGEAVVRLIALGRRAGRAELRLACLAPALLLSANLVAGTNYLRQVSALTGDQLLGVRAAIGQAGARGVPVVTTWPYWYPRVKRSLNYGPFRWRDEGVPLAFIGAHDFTRESDAIALFDTQFSPEFALQTARQGVRRFTRQIPVIAPLRPRVTTLASPTVYVVDLAAPWEMPGFAAYREDFGRPSTLAEIPVWRGLGGYEIWPDDLTMRWSVADRITVLLGPGQADTFVVTLGARAFAGVADQTVSLRVNGADCGPVPLGPDWSVARWTVPGRLVKGGWVNELAFVPRGTARPADLPGATSADRRTLGIGLDWLQIEAVAPRERP